MIIRELGQSEGMQSANVASIAFNYSAEVNLQEEKEVNRGIYGAFCDDGRTLMAQICANRYESLYGGEFIGTLGIGGVSTLPEYRRTGCIRAIFDHLYRIAPEEGWDISYLYPFSFSYYRKFGYENVISSFRIKLPMDKLDSVPKSESARLCREETDILALLDVYSQFARGKTSLFRRNEEMMRRMCSLEPNKSKRYTYLWQDPFGHPAAYATFYIDDRTLYVTEMAYADRQALIGILGFLRMYEGQTDLIQFSQVHEGSPLFYILEHYTHMECSYRAKVMGRVMNVERALMKASYPAGSGGFTLRVEDWVPYNQGVFEVEYQDGQASVTRSARDRADITAGIPALTRMLLGTDQFTAERAAYLTGIKIDNPRSDFAGYRS